jgi:hypothetical protein
LIFTNITGKVSAIIQTRSVGDQDLLELIKISTKIKIHTKKRSCRNYISEGMNAEAKKPR